MNSLDDLFLNLDGKENYLSNKLSSFIFEIQFLKNRNICNILFCVIINSFSPKIYCLAMARGNILLLLFLNLIFRLYSTGNTFFNDLWDTNTPAIVYIKDMWMIKLFKSNEIFKIIIFPECI